MKKIIAVLAALIVCAGVAIAVYILLNGTEDLPWNSQAEAEQTTANTDHNSEITTGTSDEPAITSGTTSSETTTDSAPNAAGGNPDIAEYIEVTVSEDKYFYENHEISYDDLIEVLDGLDGNTAVMISDENATLNAYENLTKALEERGILYELAS